MKPCFPESGNGCLEFFFIRNQPWAAAENFQKHKIMQIMIHLFMAGQTLIKSPVRPRNGKIFFQLFQVSGKEKTIQNKQSFSSLPAPLIRVPEQTNGNTAALFSHKTGIGITGQLTLVPLYGNPFRKTGKIPSPIGYVNQTSKTDPFPLTASEVVSSGLLGIKKPKSER